MAFQTFHQQYMLMPPITRAYLTSCVATTIAVHMNIVSPFHLYFNPALIAQGQIWRCVTCFMYFGSMGFIFLFNMLFAYRYTMMLEQNSFRGRTGDMVIMFLFGGALMCLLDLYFQIVFMGNALTMMLVYIWSRRNQDVAMNFFGILNFRAPYLPWVLFGFSLLLDSSLTLDIMGIAVGHIYFYLEDVFPYQRNGFRILKAPSMPQFITRYIEGGDVAYEALPEDQPAPGGYEWNHDQ